MRREGASGGAEPEEVTKPRGIVRVPRAVPFDHRRLAPPLDLAPILEHFWSVSWDLEHPETVETLPHPTAHVVFEQNFDGERAEVFGVGTRRFTRTLRARGWVFGIKFRPATFCALYQRSLHELTDRVVAIAEVLPALVPLEKSLLQSATLEARVELTEAALRECIRPLPTEACVLRDVVERTANDSRILSVDDLARVSGFDRRSLQRHFREFVGVGPKWVIQRYRLHEAAERIRADPSLRLSSLARELGYADQAHFSRDFKASIGESPHRFVERIAREQR